MGGEFFFYCHPELVEGFVCLVIPLLLWRGARRAGWSILLQHLPKSLRTLGPPFRAGVTPLRMTITTLRAGVAWLRMTFALLRAGVAWLRMTFALLRMGIAPLRAGVAPLRMDIAPLRMTFAPLRMTFAPFRADVARVRVLLACLMRYTSCMGRVGAASVGTVLFYNFPFVNCKPISCLYCGLCNP